MENAPISVVGREGQADETKAQARGPATLSPSGPAAASSDAGAPRVANGTHDAPGGDRAADETTSEGEAPPPMPPELAAIYYWLGKRFNFDEPEEPEGPGEGGP